MKKHLAPEMIITYVGVVIAYVLLILKYCKHYDLDIMSIMFVSYISPLATICACFIQSIFDFDNFIK
jgi:hypothetical protein